MDVSREFNVFYNVLTAYVMGLKEVVPGLQDLLVFSILFLFEFDKFYWSRELKIDDSSIAETRWGGLIPE